MMTEPMVPIFIALSEHNWRTELASFLAMTQNIDVSMWAAGLLTSGLIPAVQHSLENLLTDNPRIIPASATVFMQVWLLPSPEPVPPVWIG